MGNLGLKPFKYLSKGRTIKSIAQGITKGAKRKAGVQKLYRRVCYEGSKEKGRCTVV